MKQKYDDILSRINDKPIWYGSNGVPRYIPFNPKHISNFYSDEVILLRIRCQECHNPFLVEINFLKTSNLPSLEYRLLHIKDFWLNPIHYGDPPRHNDCVGETMNAESLKIVEFWKRDHCNWIRHSEYEISFEITNFEDE